MKIALTASPNVLSSAPFLIQGDLVEAFARAASLGYDGVELHIQHPRKVNQTEVVELSRRYGLGIPTLGTGLASGLEGLTFADADAGIRSKAVERVKEHIELASILESAVTIGLLSGRLGKGDTQEREGRRRTALACLREVCSFAEANGVTILLEPLNRYECDYINTIDDGLAIIAEIGTTNVKLLADTFHMNIEEVNITDSLVRAGSHLGHIHLVDSNRQAPGRGHLDMRAILQALHQIGYSRYLSFEVLPLPTPQQAINDGLSYIKTLLAGLT